MQGRKFAKFDCTWNQLLAPAEAAPLHEVEYDGRLAGAGLTAN